MREKLRSGRELFNELRNLSVSILEQDSLVHSDGQNRARKFYLLQRLVIDKARGILRNLELSFLDLLAKLPKK